MRRRARQARSPEAGRRARGSAGPLDRGPAARPGRAAGARRPRRAAGRRRPGRAGRRRRHPAWPWSSAPGARSLVDPRSDRRGGRPGRTRCASPCGGWRPGTGRPPRRQAARQLFDHAAGALQAALLDPIGDRLDGRPLVLIPTGPLHAIPWAALPALLGRPVTVAPSAALWLARRRPAGMGGAPASPAAWVERRQPAAEVALVAGPGLAGRPGRDRRLWPPATPGPACSPAPRRRCGAVSAALEGAALAHVAAHGTFRADNPLFSSLTLADGALTVYDLERLATPPAARGAVVVRRRPVGGGAGRRPDGPGRRRAGPRHRDADRQRGARPGRRGRGADGRPARRAGRRRRPRRPPWRRRPPGSTWPTTPCWRSRSAFVCFGAG